LGDTIGDQWSDLQNLQYISITNISLGICGSGHKAQQALKNGAIGIVFVSPVLFTVESGNKPDTTAGLHDFPMVDLVPKKEYSALVHAIRNGEQINVTITPGLTEIFEC
jgi:hypothetical protein